MLYVLQMIIKKIKKMQSLIWLHLLKKQIMRSMKFLHLIYLTTITNNIQKYNINF